MVLTKIVHNLKDELCRVFGKGQWGQAAKPPTVNLFYYIPCFQASFQLVPFHPSPSQVTLVGSVSPFFRVLTSNHSAGYLNEDELNALVGHAMNRPHVRESLLAIGEMGAYSLLEVTEGNQVGLLYTLLSRFNNDPVVFVRELEQPEARALFFGIVHAALSALPQFPTKDTFVSGEKNAYDFVEFERKRDSLEGCAVAFDRMGTQLHFAYRLNLLLSVIESLQWDNDTAFCVINNPLEYAGGDTHRILEREWIPMHQIRMYFYGAYKADPLSREDPITEARRKGVVRVLRERLTSVGHIISEIVLDEYRSYLLANRKYVPTPSADLLNKLLHFLGPSQARMVCLKNAGSHEAVIHTKCDIENHSSLENVLRGVWSDYKLESKFNLDPACCIDEGIKVLPDPPRMTVYAQRLLAEPCYLELDFPVESDPAHEEYRREREQYEYAKRYAECLVVLLRRLALRDQFKPNWLECPLHSSYSEHREKQALVAPHIKQEEKEAEFLVKLLEHYANHEQILVFDCGNANGVVPNKLNQAYPNCRIITIEPSQSIESIAHHKNSSELVLLRFNTLGCLTDDVSFLRGAYNMVRPGGVLVIEQLNPLKNRPDRIGIVHNVTGAENPENGEPHGCVTYSSYLPCALYTRQCCFHFLTNNERNDDKVLTAKPDYFEVRLYNLEWFEKHLQDMLGARLCSPSGDFYGAEYTEQASNLLIIVGQKPHKKADREKARNLLTHLESQMYNRDMDGDISKFKDEGHVLDWLLNKDYPAKYADLSAFERGDLEGLVDEVTEFGNSE